MVCDSKRVVVSYRQKYVHKVLVNCLVKHAQEKREVRWIDRPDMSIAVDWDEKNQPKQTKLVVCHEVYTDHVDIITKSKFFHAESMI